MATNLVTPIVTNLLHHEFKYLFSFDVFDVDDVETTTGARHTRVDMFHLSMGARGRARERRDVTRVIESVVVSGLIRGGAAASGKRKECARSITRITR